MSAVIHTGLFSILERFPDRKDTIKRLFRESAAFQSLCSDYRTCIEAHRHWSQSDSAEGAVRREEYAALMKDLETEILQNLNETG